MVHVSVKLKLSCTICSYVRFREYYIHTCHTLHDIFIMHVLLWLTTAQNRRGVGLVSGDFFTKHVCQLIHVCTYVLVSKAFS